MIKKEQSVVQRILGAVRGDNRPSVVLARLWTGFVPLESRS